MRTKFSNTLIPSIFFGSFLFGVNGPVLAQGATQVAPDAAISVNTTSAPSPIGEDPGPVYTQIVKQWAEVTHFAKNAADVAVGKLTVDIKADPRLHKIVTPAFQADLEQFFYELFISQETINEIAKLYAQYFTLDEMQELINFYKTPLGQKLIKSNAEIMVRSQQIGAQLLKKHEKDYMEVVAKYIKPIQEENGKAKSSGSSTGTAPAPTVKQN